MQVFAVTIERTARRRLRVLASSSADAVAMVSATLPTGTRATSADAVTDETITGAANAELGIEALDHILTREFLPTEGGKVATVADWVRAARDGDPQSRANRALAMAGLRVLANGDDPMVYFATPTSHPLLARWCAGTPFAGATFLPALAALPGAMRLASGLKFAGISSRVVALPFSTVFEGPGA